MVRAVDGKIEIPGSSRTSDFFFVFLLFHLPHLRKAKNSAFAEDGGFFWAKKLRILCNIYYINNR